MYLLGRRDYLGPQDETAALLKVISTWTQKRVKHWNTTSTKGPRIIITYILLGSRCCIVCIVPRGSKYSIHKDSGPQHVKSMFFGIRVLQCWVLGFFGVDVAYARIPHPDIQYRPRATRQMM